MNWTNLKHYLNQQHKKLIIRRIEDVSSEHAKVYKLELAAPFRKAEGSITTPDGDYPYILNSKEIYVLGDDLNNIVHVKRRKGLLYAKTNLLSDISRPQGVWTADDIYKVTRPSRVWLVSKSFACHRAEFIDRRRLDDVVRNMYGFKGSQQPAKS